MARAAENTPFKKKKPLAGPGSGKERHLLQPGGGEGKEKRVKRDKR